MHKYIFIPLTSDHLPLMKIWLAQPHVTEWWGEEDTEFGLIEKHLEIGDVDMRLVKYKGRELGFIQDYDVSLFPDVQYQGLPIGSRGIDQFIGPREMLGEGYGPKFVRARSLTLLKNGAPVIVTDPHRDNHRARRAYAKAGFEERGEFQLNDGPVILMVFKG